MTDDKPVSTNLNFPKNFLWGASVSTHQVEGGNHNQWTVWELETAKTKAKSYEENYQHLECFNDIKQETSLPSNYVSGLAANHYNLFKEDFRLAKKLNLTTLRSGIEWSRVEPEEGEFSKQALNHYKDYFNELNKIGITPFLTLWHWTLPEWFANKGGFLKRSNVKYFIRYVKFIMDNFGVNIKYFITINEPTTYAAMSYHEDKWPPEQSSTIGMIRVLYNLTIAHKKAYKLIKKRYPNSKIGLAHNCTYFYAGNDSLLSRFSALMAHKFGNELFIKMVRKKQDYLGLNYYFANRLIGWRVKNTNEVTNDLGWNLEPDKIRPLTNQLYKKFKLPIIITESGVADRNDVYRKWWISQSIKALSGAVEDGVKVQGYIHWSLLDNFEWAEGFWPRFGLINVDYKTQSRTIRRSAIWYAKVIKNFTKGR